jgi:hypothetical protein
MYEGKTYNRETLGNRGFECLISLCPCPCPFPFEVGAEVDSLGVGAGADADFSSFLGSSFFSVVVLALASPSGPRFDGISIEPKSSPSSARNAMI